MNGKPPAQGTHSPAIGAGRRSLQQRLLALRAGLRAALGAFRTHPIKHPQR